MSPQRRLLLIAFAATAATPVSGQAQPAPRAPQEGKDYLVLKTPVPTEGGGKVEVLEFFQYSCPHCYSFDPYLTAWRKKLPSDVDYKRIPIAWDNSTLPHVKIYYTLEALKKTEELHAKVFRAIQVDRRPLLKPEEIAKDANARKARNWSASAIGWSTAGPTWPPRCGSTPG